MRETVARRHGELLAGQPEADFYRRHDGGLHVVVPGRKNVVIIRSIRDADKRLKALPLVMALAKLHLE